MVNEVKCHITGKLFNILDIVFHIEILSFSLSVSALIEWGIAKLNIRVALAYCKLKINRLSPACSLRHLQTLCDFGQEVKIIIIRRMLLVLTA